MRVLALDTSLAACSVAVFDTDEGGVLARESRPMDRGHAEALMPMVARVMSEADTDFAELGRIVVTIGPGSFTGLRVGVAAARGLALAAGKPVVGVTTLAAFAAPYVASDDKTPLLSVIDARHERVFMQLVGEGGRATIAPRIAPVREAARIATVAPTRIVGSGAALLQAAWVVGARQALCFDTQPAPDIDWVARLGAVAPDTGDQPRPLYLAPPDARPQEAARLARR